MKQLGTLTLAIVSLMSVIFVSAAAAHDVKYGSTVTIEFTEGGTGPDTFFGTVDSTTTRCEADRKVNLGMRDGPSTPVGTDRTDSTGAWEITQTSSFPAGNYFAVATKKVLRKNANHGHFCRKATSGDVTID